MMTTKEIKDMIKAAMASRIERIKKVNNAYFDEIREIQQECPHEETTRLCYTVGMSEDDSNTCCCNACGKRLPYDDNH